MLAPPKCHTVHRFNIRKNSDTIVRFISRLLLSPKSAMQQASDKCPTLSVFVDAAVTPRNRRHRYERAIFAKFKAASHERLIEDD